MKKIIFFLLVSCAAVSTSARTVDVSSSYTGASHFDQVRTSAFLSPTLNTLVGVEAKWAKEHAFKDHIYTVAVPFSLEWDMMYTTIRPFYYFKNKSYQPGLQDTSAFGVNGQMRLDLRQDEVNDIYTQAFLSASFARQKGTVFYEDATAENRYYSQAAYQLGFSHTMFNAFGFDAFGTVFHYPDGISGVTGLHSIMDQQELADTQTLDIMHELPKYTLAGKITRMWAENNSSIYVGYRYGEYHTTDPEHSVIVGNSFYLFQRVAVDLAYNHVRTVHNKNRRDIFRIQLQTFF